MKRYVLVLMVLIMMFVTASPTTGQGNQLDIRGMALSPDGNWFATVSSIGVWLYDVDHLDSPTRWLRADNATSVAFNHDGSMIAAGSGATVHVWDAVTGEKLADVQVMERAPATMGVKLNIAFSMDGKLATGLGRRVQLWAVADGTNIATLEKTAGIVNSIAFSLDGNTIAVASKSVIELWDVNVSAIRAVFEGHESGVRGLAFSPDGATLASASHDGTVRLWDVATGATKSVLTGHTDWVFDVAFSGDGSLLVSGDRDGSVRLWQVETGELLNAFAIRDESVVGVALEPSGSWLVAADSQHNIRLWDVATGAEKASLSGPNHLNPTPRAYHAMAYDSESDRVLLFGGEWTWSQELWDAWVYDPASNQWEQLTAQAPCLAESAAYDAESDRIITWGGPIGGGDGWDTCAYDYNTDTWEKMSPSASPTWAYYATMNYDEESDRVILYGGGQSLTVGFNHTWAYDYNTDTWTEMSPEISPPIYCCYDTGYHPPSDRVIGWGSDVMANDLRVWVYDYNSNTWASIEPTGGPDVSWGFHRMIYHPSSDRFILFGGMVQNYLLIDDTFWAYSYTTNTWTRLESPVQPAYRGVFDMVYDSKRDKIILFGGDVGNDRHYDSVLNNETWIYDPNTNEWTDMTHSTWD